MRRRWAQREVQLRRVVGERLRRWEGWPGLTAADRTLRRLRLGLEDSGRGRSRWGRHAFVGEMRHCRNEGGQCPRLRVRSKVMLQCRVNKTEMEKGKGGVSVMAIRGKGDWQRGVRTA